MNYLPPCPLFFALATYSVKNFFHHPVNLSLIRLINHPTEKSQGMLLPKMMLPLLLLLRALPTFTALNDPRKKKKKKKQGGEEKKNFDKKHEYSWTSHQQCQHPDWKNLGAQV